MTSRAKRPKSSGDASSIVEVKFAWPEPPPDSRVLKLLDGPFLSDGVGNRIQRLRSERFSNIFRVIHGTPDGHWYLWWEVDGEKIERVQDAIEYVRKPKRKGTKWQRKPKQSS